MKVVILSRYQNSVSRGAETFVKELSDRLSFNNQVKILSGKDSDSIKSILDQDPDIVISINGGTQSIKASIGRLLKKYKLVITGQAGIGRGEFFNLMTVPNLYVALTDKMLGWAKNCSLGTKLVKIPNGVDLEKFNPKGERFNFDLEKPVILSVGALEWYKHHERTIKAMSLLKKGSLVIVGSGSEKESLQDLGEQMLSNRFKILESSYENLPKVYRSADLFVLPSWEREAFGIVYLEALASGLGVVAPNDSSRNEIIGEAGILVDVSNAVKYAQAIKEGLEDQWRNKAIAQAHKFSWDLINKQYEEAFVKLLNR